MVNSSANINAASSFPNSSTIQSTLPFDSQISSTASTNINNINGNNEYSVAAATIAAAAYAMALQHHPHIKYGYLRKQKTNKRKFFVLKTNPSLSKTTISYYDNEKKFKDKSIPRREILLADCFAVARIPDPKKIILGIYTKEDLLSLIMENEEQFTDWLRSIRAILYSLPEYKSRPLKDFEYIWQGRIDRVEGGLSNALLGLYRFCLMPTKLYFIKVETTFNSHTNGQNSTNTSTGTATAVLSTVLSPTTTTVTAPTKSIYEFPLSIIHSCGHTGNKFYLRIGRLSELGAGELWISTDENYIAEHMHEKIKSFWNKNKKDHSSAASTSNSSQEQHQADDQQQKTVDNKSINYYTAFPNTITRTNSIVSSNQPTYSSVSGSNVSTMQAKNQQQQNCNRPYSMCESTSGSGTSLISPATTFSHFYSFLFQQFYKLHYNSPHLHPPHCGHVHPTIPSVATSQQKCNQKASPNCGTLSSTSQSPTNSRERLHSGSWSRTASDCSQEDISSICSSTAATPVGQALCWDQVNQHQLYHPFYHPHHIQSNPSYHAVEHVSKTKNSSNSSLSTEFDDQQHNTTTTTANIDQISPTTYENEKDVLSMFYKSYLPATPCQTCLQFSSMWLQMAQQQHLNSATTTNTCSQNSSHQSPTTSPKCHHCSSFHHMLSSPCQSSSSCSQYQHHVLPTIWAGEPSDYVPMKPLNSNNNNSDTANENNNQLSSNETNQSEKGLDEQEEDSYLLMAPLSPNPCKQDEENKNSLQKQPIANSVTNSIEFQLENDDNSKNQQKLNDEDYQNNKDQEATTDNKITGHSDKNSQNNESINDDSQFPSLTRAYSTGSKPQPLAPSIGAQCGDPKADSKDSKSNNKQSGLLQCGNSANTAASHLRTRAASTGSHGMKRGYLHKRKAAIQNRQPLQPIKNQQNEQQQCDKNFVMNSTGSSTSLQELGQQDKTNKAASAPILSSFITPRTRSHTLGSKPTSFNSNSAHNSNSMTPMMFPPFPFYPLCSPLTVPAHPQQANLLSNVYGAGGEIASSSTNQVPSGVSFCPNHYPPVFSPGCLQQTSSDSQNSLKSQQNQPPIAPQVSFPEEGDLMEIDFGAKQKRDELTDDKNHHDRDHHHHHHAHGRKRSDSSVSVKSSGSANQNHMKTSSSSVSNHQMFDNLVHSFKNSFSIHSNNNSNKSKCHSSTSKPVEQDDEDEKYVLFSPGQGIEASTSPTSPKQVTNQFSFEDDESIDSKVIHRRSQSVTVSSPVDNLPINPSNDADDEEEESSYVLMAPENVTKNQMKVKEHNPQHKKSLNFFKPLIRNFSVTSKKHQHTRRGSSKSESSTDISSMTASQQSNKPAILT